MICLTHHIPVRIDEFLGSYLTLLDFSFVLSHINGPPESPLFEKCFNILLVRLFFQLKLRHSYLYTFGKKEIHPYYISPIEMRSLWMEIKCVKSATRLLDRIWVNKGGLDLSKEVLWVSVGQRAAELRAVNVGGRKEILPSSPVRTRFAHAGPIGRIFFDLQLWQPVKLLFFDLQRPTVPL